MERMGGIRPCSICCTARDLRPVIVDPGDGPIGLSAGTAPTAWEAVVQTGHRAKKLKWVHNLTLSKVAWGRTTGQTSEGCFSLPPAI